MKIMNLGIDCIALPVNFSGAAYYILNLTRNLLTLDRSFYIQIYCKKEHRGLFAEYLREGDSIIIIPVKNRLQQLIYYEKFLSSVLISRKTDVFLATHYMGPAKNAQYKIITIFHDLGFVLYPEYYPRLKSMYFKRRFPYFLKNSDKVITVSENTRRDLIRLYPFAHSYTECIYPGTDHLQNITVKSLSGVTDYKPFVLAVNSFEKRKNIPLILSIFNRLKKKYSMPHKLLLVGPANNPPRELETEFQHSPFRESIHFLKDISSQQLKGLYRNADLFINTSHYEGFGFTPVEAVREGCPSFIYPNKAAQELFGDHPYLIASQSVDEWSEIIAGEREKQFSNKINPKALSQLSWGKCARQFREVIDTF